jgi:hypothetical protein
MTAWNARQVIETTESPEPIAEVPDEPAAQSPVAPLPSSPIPWDEKVVAAVTRWCLAPNRGGAFATVLMLAGWFTYPRAAFAVVGGLAVASDYRHDKRIKHGRQRWKRINARQKRMKAHKKKHIELGRGKDKTKIPCVWRTPVAVAKAVKFETGITEKGRQDAWLATSCEQLGIDPPVHRIEVTKNAVGEVWALDVPVTPSMNPSILASPNYNAAFRGCVRGTCYGVHIHAATNRGRVAYMHVIRHDITEVDAGPSPLVTRARGQKPVVNAPLTVAQPVQIGSTAMCQHFYVNLMDRSGIGIFGMNGTGKTVLLHTFVCHILAAPDAGEKLGDMKDGMDGSFYRGANLLYTEEPSEVHEWISQYVVPAERTKTEVLTWRRAGLALERAKYLQSKGLRNWEPGCGLDADFLIVDEVDGVMKDDQFALAWMINKLRAIGVRVIYATQLPRADTLDKRLSSATNVRIAFRVSDVIASNVALGAGAVGRGYDASKLPVPGYCYVLGSTEQDPVVVRTHMLEDADVKLIASKFPRPKIQQSGDSSDPAADLTVSDPPMEGPTAGDSQIVRPALTLVPARVEPPTECATNEQLMRLWEAMPGKRAELANIAGYHPNYVSEVMNRWAKQGHVLSVRGQWTHRQPRT